MKFSENWLRTYVNPDLNSDQLAHQLTMAGLEVEALESDLDDRLFTLKLTPNRSDCLSVAGVAREVAAITGVALELPQVGATKVAIPDCLTLRVEVPDACPRYAGRVVRGVRAAATTPEWMVQRFGEAG